VEKQKTILIVEDEEFLVDSYSELLSSVGYKVLKATDGYKGMQALIDNLGSVDLVLLDLMMPGIDGLEVLRNIIGAPDKYGAMHIVVLTAMVSDQVIKEAYEVGAKAYLIKSELSTDDLVNEVKRILGS